MPFNTTPSTDYVINVAMAQSNKVMHAVTLNAINSADVTVSFNATLSTAYSINAAVAPSSNALLLLAAAVDVSVPFNATLSNAYAIKAIT